MQRATLAMLLLRANQVVPLDQLVDGIWGATPATTARALVHSYVSRLRKVLDPNGADQPARQLLVTTPAGYLLRVQPDQLDWFRFERLVDQARRASAHGRIDDAVDGLGSALALWRGPALADLRSEAVRADAHRLEERRMAVVEERIDLALLSGRHSELVGELKGLVAAFPFREGLVAQLMLALYRSGRQADALEVYQATRRTMAQELGIEPGPALQQLQRSILTADPSLALAVPEAPSEAAGLATVASHPGPGNENRTPEHLVTVPPCQLPPDIASFTDREQELEQLIALMNPAAEPHEAVVIAAIHGPPGVGKSALACRVAHQLTSRFPDGQLYANLHGASAAVAASEPTEVLGRFLRALGVGDARIPGQPEERAALYRSLLADRRVLVVLDNAADAAQVRLLLPTRPGCAALLTSRQHLVELDGADHLDLDVLTQTDAVTLLGRLAGAKRAAAEPQAAAEVARLCGYLPLALRIAGARLASRPAWPVHTLAARLASEYARLDELQLDGLAVRASLQLSYQAMRAGEGPGGEVAAQAFRLIGMLKGPDAGVPVVAAMLKQPHAAAEAALERLVDARLLETVAPRRYRFHDLVRLFARERAAEEDSQTERAAALRRALDWYLTAARQADLLLRPGRRAAEDHAEGDVEGGGPMFADRRAALTWLEVERANLVAAVTQAAAGAAPAVAWRLAAALFGFFDVRGHWDDWEQVGRLALQVAQGCNDRAAEARAWRDLGAVAWRRFRLEEASSYLQRSLELRRRLEDAAGEAETLNSIGLVLTAERRYEEATVCLKRGLALFREQQDRRGEGLVLNNLGDLYRSLGQFKDAVACLQGDLAICRESGDRRGEAITLCNLGEVYRDQGCGEEAFVSHEQSMAICHELGDRRGQGLNLDGQGEARRLQGRHDEALAYLRQSLTLLHEVGDRYSEADARWHLGVTMDELGDHRHAREHWRTALAIYDQIGAPEAVEVRAALDR
jgi:DNA-binding SARP family transcriptional activator